jgi:hypothetical protein
LDDLRRAEEMNPNLAGIHANRAFYCINAWLRNPRPEDLKQAVASVRRAIELGPARASTYKLGIDVLVVKPVIGEDDWKLMLEWAREAVRLGLDAQMFANDPALAPLRARPEFAEVLNTQAERPLDRTSIYLVDPTGGWETIDFSNR